MSIVFESQIEKYGNKGEKTGWTYILIDIHKAKQLNPTRKTSFRVKGLLDSLPIEGISILPIGDGHFILPLNLTLRKLLKKRVGDKIKVNISIDVTPYIIDPDFVDCLSTESEAYTFFKSLPESHQKYFSKWIQSSKTSETKAKRIAEAVWALSKKRGYADMIRSRKSNNL
ncbi:MAG: DUF1905 domain-containing protein [Saprospiraceae bacterium]|nr:DUF1905 domain-containing protein [Candidatus Vicinibacter affinis]MBK6822395.1 DUF1905 domain-containing protein [Candidatus Vicinibacter affinis]MBK7301824.1 DUF1905 domain-containing protein [Candidatus Vicinibacter affinis]MBK7692962.1 DUF1905 domain-containing protein [Candidatus Vicinibacter affinis]MBK8402700.1 DUF1905 domain-containing protein [Candidatus Vicinibacter affinis]